MKKKNFKQKLNLNKKAIVNLRPESLLNVKGGETATCFHTLCDCEVHDTYTMCETCTC